MYSFNNIRESDIMIGTYFSTLPFLRKSKSKIKIHLSQGYEGFLHEKVFLETINVNYKMINEKIVISKWQKEIIKKKFEIDSNYISNGIDQYIFLFKKSKRKKIPKILVVGDEKLKIKGVKATLKVINKLDRKVEIVRLGRNMAKMSQLAIARMYESCDITICASDRVEGFWAHTQVEGEA